MVLAANIKFLRKWMQLNQGELAVKLGFEQSSVSSWEKESRIPRKEAILKLCEFFEVSEHNLFSDRLKDELELEQDAPEKILKGKNISEESKLTAMILMQIRNELREIKTALKGKICQQ